MAQQQQAGYYTYSGPVAEVLGLLLRPGDTQWLDPASHPGVDGGKLPKEFKALGADVLATVDTGVPAGTPVDTANAIQLPTAQPVAS